MKKFLKNILVKFSRIFGLRVSRLSGNCIKSKGVFFKSTKIYFYGRNNLIEIKKCCRFKNCTFKIFGNNNVIKIDESCIFDEVCFWIEDENNQIFIGHKTKFCGKAQIAAIEGTTISIGNDCLIASNLLIRTGDSHSILDECGARTNFSLDIKIGNHVWVGTNVCILKGVEIQSDSVVGACSLVNKRIDKANVIICGNPARIVKDNINWDEERIKRNII